jgi:hypothetical protein
MDLINLTQDKDQWRSLVETVMNFPVPYNFGKFMTIGITGDSVPWGYSSSLSRTTLKVTLTEVAHRTRSVYISHLLCIPFVAHNNVTLKYKIKLHGMSPQANYTDRATAACRRSDCQLLRIEGATWSA